MGPREMWWVWRAAPFGIDRINLKTSEFCAQFCKQIYECNLQLNNVDYLAVAVTLALALGLALGLALALALALDLELALALALV
jgi:hypothetical protein